jgi:hypothetical protein
LEEVAAPAVASPPVAGSPGALMRPIITPAPSAKTSPPALQISCVFFEVIGGY